MVKTLRDGRTLELTINPDGIGATVTINGQQVDRPLAIVRSTKAGAPVPFALGTIGLTADEARTVQAEITAAKAAYALTPTGLRDQRQSLVRDVNIAVAGAREDRNAAFDRDAQTIPGYDSPAVLSARDALRTFDAAHPEIAEQIEADRDAHTTRNLWN